MLRGYLAWAEHLVALRIFVPSKPGWQQIVSTKRTWWTLSKELCFEIEKNKKWSLVRSTSNESDGTKLNE